MDARQQLGVAAGASVICFQPEGVAENDSG